MKALIMGIAPIFFATNLSAFNPELRECNIELHDVHKHLKNVKEGFYAVGDGEIKKNRDTIVYIHGWSQTGAAETFKRAELWNKEGFNTIHYQWHCDSYDPGSAPNDAIKRIWRRSAEKLYQDFSDYVIPALGANYTDTKELRIVGHSLGSQMATYLAFKLKEESQFKVSRLELLDPYITGAKIPADSTIYEYFNRSEENDTGTKIFRTIFRSNNLPVGTGKIPTVAYVSFIGVLNKFQGQYRIWEENSEFNGITGEWKTHISTQFSALDGINIQTQDLAWLASLTDTDKNFADRLREKLTLQHLKIVDYYMDSIDSNAVEPKYQRDSGSVTRAFSAKFPTSELEGIVLRRMLKQVKGEKTITASDDVYIREDREEICPKRSADSFTLFCKDL